MELKIRFSKTKYWNYLLIIAPGITCTAFTAVSNEKLFGHPIPRLHDENVARNANKIANGINFFKIFAFILI